MLDALFFLLIILGGLLAWVVVMVCVIGPFIYFALRWERKRSAALRPVAEDLGLAFVPKPASADVEKFSGFELFEKGFQWIGNLMRARTQGADVSIFDYSYSSGSGDSRSKYRQTVICFESRSLNLPRFLLQPENVLHKLAGLLGLQDINFSDFPAFSNRYHLAGEDEAAVRRVFHPSVLQRFEQIDNVWIEGHGRQLIVFRRGNYAEPEQIGPLLQEAFDIYRALRSATAPDRHAARP